MIADPGPLPDDAPDPPRDVVIDGAEFVRLCYAARERLWARRWSDAEGRENADQARKP